MQHALMSGTSLPGKAWGIIIFWQREGKVRVLRGPNKKRQGRGGRPCLSWGGEEGEENLLFSAQAEQAKQSGAEEQGGAGQRHRGGLVHHRGAAVYAGLEVEVVASHGVIGE